jgi:hydrogenase 3 maturation protease
MMAGPSVVLTVGNSLMGDDGAGPLLAELMDAEPVPGWLPVDGDSMPENVVRHVCSLKPELVLIVDATELGLAPGELRFVEQEHIVGMRLMNTHNMPLSFLMERLREDVPKVVFLGIQPADVTFYGPLSDEVRRAVRRIHNELAQGLTSVPWLQERAAQGQSGADRGIKYVRNKGDIV